MRKHCAYGTCPAIVDRGYCPKHAVHHEHQRFNWDVRRWYRTMRWRQLRAQVLREEPRCTGRGDGLPCGAPTTDADHIRRHGGDPALFWDRRNLQGKCHRCHSSKTRVEGRDATSPLSARK
jgi:5-methylcytosine-specific restriction enzyme A